MVSHGFKAVQDFVNPQYAMAENLQFSDPFSCCSNPSNGGFACFRIPNPIASSARTAHNENLRASESLPQSFMATKAMMYITWGQVSSGQLYVDPAQD